MTVRTLSRLALACGMVLSAVGIAANAQPPQLAPAVASVPLPSKGYLWYPQIAPQGPVVVIVSLPEQRAYVYRNGIRIGLSKVSTGKPGFETPTGVFEILEKRREHYSNLYDNAPMPFMQRLTWDGVALHAGKVPDRPASHGCVRLPYAFSQALFAVTSRGMTVIITDKMIEPSIASPNLFASSAAPPVIVGADEVPESASYRWTPELSASGPMAIVLSTSDREVRVMRNAIEIGRASVTWNAPTLPGTRVYVLLDGNQGDAAAVVSTRPPLRWQQVPLVDEHQEVAPLDMRTLVESGQLHVDPDFVSRVRDALTPGTTLLLTDKPLQPLVAGDLSILSGDQTAPALSAPIPH